MTRGRTYPSATVPTGANRPDTRQEGMTLVELLIAMMLFLVILGAVYGVWNRLEKTYVFAEDDMVAQAEARMALGEIVEFVRTARVPETPANDSLDTVIPFANPYEIWIWTDVDNDSNHGLELVRFRVTLEGGRKYLVRQESLSADGVFDGAPMRVVNQNVQNDDASVSVLAYPLFQYFDSSGVELNPSVTLALNSTYQSVDVTKIRSVRINLRVDIDPTRSPIVHELSSVVQPRNLRQY